MYNPNIYPPNQQLQTPINRPVSGLHMQQPNPQQLKYVHNVEAKGTIRGVQPKTIEIQPNSNKFIVYTNQAEKQKGKARQFPLNQVTFSHEKRQQQGKIDYLHVDTNNGKKYSFKSDNSGTIADQIKKGQTVYQINQLQFHQQPITMVPKQVNYITPLQSGMNQFQKILIPSNQLIFNQQQFPIAQNQPQYIQPTEDYSHYPRKQYYFNPEDWLIDKEKGSIIFVNQQKKCKQKKVIGWVIKKFLSTGSFMGISFPTFVMKPQTILESYAKAIGAAPFLFDNTTNLVQRMKKFVCLIQSFSLVFCDLTKPFNPPLGQTFQARIANGNYYAQQICHHPPVSAFFYEGKGYRISGSFQLTASIGPNSATGSFAGDLKVEFNDGTVYVGRIPGGQFSGFIFGDQKFEAYGTFYAYNNKKLVCSASTIDKKNFFEGYIGKLKSMHEDQFFDKMNSDQRFTKFPFFQRQCFDTVFSCMEMKYHSSTSFDGKQYFNAFDAKYLPFLPQPIANPKLLLKSDCRYRKDIPLRVQQKFDQAQKQKQKMQDEQRYFRKLRLKYDPWHHHQNE